MYLQQYVLFSKSCLIYTYALKSCLLINTALIPVTHAIIFRQSTPYANENNGEFSKIFGNFKSAVLSSHSAQIKSGFCLRS